MDLPQNVGSKRSSQHISEIAEQDCKRVCNPDLTRPFTNVDDAIDRLLPFHVLGTEEPVEVDAREAQEAGAPLAAARWDAWQAYATKRTNEFERKRWQVLDRIEAAEKKGFEDSQAVRLSLHVYAAAEAERDLEAEKKRRANAKKEAEKKALEEAMRQQAEMAQKVAAAAAAQLAAANAQVAAAQAAAQAHAASAAPGAPPGALGPAGAAPPAAAAAGAVAAPPAAPVAPKPAPVAAPPPQPQRPIDPRSQLLALKAKFKLK